MKRQWIKLATAGGLAAGMIFAQAQAPAAQPNQEKSSQTRQQWQERRRQAHERMMAELNLSPEQKTKVQAIFAKGREESKPVRAELRQNREAMFAAVKANDSAQIDKLARERGRLTAKIATMRAETMAKFYQELTPAQKAKFDEIHARRQARMHERTE